MIRERSHMYIIVYMVILEKEVILVQVLKLET